MELLPAVAAAHTTACTGVGAVKPAASSAWATCTHTHAAEVVKLASLRDHLPVRNCPV
jgi:hypothetical protein